MITLTKKVTSTFCYSLTVTRIPIITPTTGLERSSEINLKVRFVNAKKLISFSKKIAFRLYYDQIGMIRGIFSDFTEKKFMSKIR